MSGCLPLLKPYPHRPTQRCRLFPCVYANKPVVRFSRPPLLCQGSLGCLDTSPPPFLSCFNSCLVGNLIQSHTKDQKTNGYSTSLPVVTVTFEIGTKVTSGQQNVGRGIINLVSFTRLRWSWDSKILELTLLLTGTEGGRQCSNVTNCLRRNDVF